MLIQRPPTTLLPKSRTMLLSFAIFLVSLLLYLVDSSLSAPSPLLLLAKDGTHHNKSHSDESATVIGLAVGYDLAVFERFVGSLRRTGYQGHIILGLSPDVSPSVLDYLSRRRVTVHILKWTLCDYPYKDTTCAAPYSNLKIRWGRYPLARDWLQACDTCTGPVLFTDVRDVVFQQDPFSGADVAGLQLFAEHPYQTTLFKLVMKPMKKCKNIKIEKPMLCSGTTAGTRDAMVDYLQVMHQELDDWSKHENCRLVKKQGGDQAVHNYVYYTGKLPDAEVIPFRKSGIVSTVAVWGKLIQDQVKQANAPVNSWGDMVAWNVTDAQGFFLEADGSHSRVVHQFDRFHWAGYDEWLRKQGLDRDLI